MKEYTCSDCRRKIQKKDRLRIVVSIPNKTFSEDPKGLAGSKSKSVYKCPHCRGRLFPFGSSKTAMRKLKNHWLYKIVARNAGMGIWITKRKSFLISRWKFRDNFLFEEFHYVTGPPFGTAFEISGPIEEVPYLVIWDIVYDKGLLTYLNKKEDEMTSKDERSENTVGRSKNDVRTSVGRSGRTRSKVN